MMACMLLIRMRFADSAAAAIERYNRVRVRDLCGLTVMSQRKWVRYYEQLLARSQPSSPVAPLQEPGFWMKALAIHNSLTATVPPKLQLRVYQLDNTSHHKVLQRHLGFAICFSLSSPRCYARRCCTNPSATSNSLCTKRSVGVC